MEWVGVSWRKKSNFKGGSMMIVPIIPCFQIVGVFIASFMGISIIGRCISRNSVAASHMIIFGVGMAMATCGLFF
jgi:hypothetical protein